MGLTRQSTTTEDAAESLTLKADHRLIALAGNPNVGKSTVFNALTGLKQHTGNWTGKTVATAAGEVIKAPILLVDLPGTYSLMAHSKEEEVARDFICFGGRSEKGQRLAPHGVVVVCDGSALERNLNLVLQCIEITPHLIVCVNLLDEAKKRGITVDLEELSRLLGVKTVGTSARNPKDPGLNTLVEQVMALPKEDTLNHSEENFPFNPLVTYGELGETAIAHGETRLKTLLPADDPPNPRFLRWLAIRFLCGDKDLLIQAVPKTDLSTLDPTEILTPLSLTLQSFEDIIAEGLVNKGAEIAGAVTGVTVKEPPLSEEVCPTCRCADPDCPFNRANNPDSDEVTAEHLLKTIGKDRRLDKILTHRWLGLPVMLLGLGVIFWITLSGANIPSRYLSQGLNWLGEHFRTGLNYLSAPIWLTSLIIDGVYKVLAWVVAVMLPPMAIFFPLFTLLEDVGYLPRVAFNLDKYFQKAKACGKQALTMCMGFGCNAAGIVGCRIIDSPRERLIAILTNNFVPCNGRFPPPPKGQKEMSAGFYIPKLCKHLPKVFNYIF